MLQGSISQCELLAVLQRRSTFPGVAQATSQPVVVTKKFVGIDDWAGRKGQKCGSILVDLESRRPIDLLPDGSGDTFAVW